MAHPKAPQRNTPRTAQHVGKYRFVRLLGEGGMGQVYEVRHIELERRAALKILRPELAQDPETAARFFREARAMSQMQHPALVHVYEYGHLDDGSAYIVMEYVEGHTLREEMGRRGGKLSAVAATTYARHVAAALQVAHDKGVVHRDLKPENIMLTVTEEDFSVDSRVKILDFGIAKTLGTLPSAEALQTHPGQVIGTPMYLAPEQAHAPDKISGHTDVYGLGVVLFEMLTGRLPFAAEEGLEMVRKHLFSAPPRLRDITPQADEELDALIDRMLAKAPEQRPNMREVKLQLRKISQRLELQDRDSGVEEAGLAQAATLILGGRRSAAPARPASRFRRLAHLRKHPTSIAFGVLLCGCLALGIWLISRSASRPTPHREPTAADLPSDSSARVPPPAPTSVTGAAPAAHTTPNAATADVSGPEDRISTATHDSDGRTNQKDAPRPAPPTVSKAAVGKPTTPDAVLHQAQAALDHNDYAHAMALARTVLKQSPYRAWRLIGTAACMKRDVATSNEAFQRLDIAGQLHLIAVCGVHRVEKTSTGFRLSKQ